MTRRAPGPFSLYPVCTFTPFSENTGTDIISVNPLSPPLLTVLVAIFFLNWVFSLVGYLCIHAIVLTLALS